MRPLIALNLLLWCLPLVGSSQIIDPNFNAPLPIAKPEISVVAIQPDGKILLGGMFDLFDSQGRTTLIRLNADGSLDNSFDFPLAKRKNAIVEIQVKSNGDLIVRDDYFVYTLGPGGEILNTFVTVDSGESFFKIKLQPDGKTLVAGYSNSTGYFLRRHNPDGSLDPTFSYSGTTHIENIELQNDKIIIAHDYRFFLRLESNGAIDASFNPGPYLSHPVNVSGLDGIAVQPDGKIIRYYSDRFNYFPQLTTADMIRHAESSASEEVFTDVHGMIVGIKFFNDKIYIQLQEEVDLIGNKPSRIIRLNQNGTIDNTFSPVTTNFRMFSQSFDVAADGSIVVANSSFDNLFGINRYNADGSLVETFAPQLKMYGTISNVRRIGEKLLVSGQFIKLGDHMTKHVGLLRMDGTPDNQFSVVQDYGPVYAVEPTNNNGFLISARHNIFKVDETGVYDPSFTIERTFDLYEIWKMKELPDGKIVALGPNNLYRLMPNGALDPTFARGTGSGGIVGGQPNFAMQTDGKILYTSVGTNWNGTPTSPLKRINVDGSLDTTFPIGTGPDQNSFWASVISLPQGGFFLTGHMNSFNGRTITHQLIKVNADGTFDNSFMDNFELLESSLTLLFKADPYGFLRSTISFQSADFIRKLELINVDGTLNEDFSIPEDLIFQSIEDFTSSETSIVIAGEQTINGTKQFISALLRIPIWINGSSVTQSPEDVPFELSPQDLIVDGLSQNQLDNSTLSINPGSHYAVNGNTVTPEHNYNGDLVLSVTLTEGADVLAQGLLTIEITPVNDIPVITAVNNFNLIENTSVLLQKSQVTFSDIDTPGDQLVLEVLDGNNYSVNGNSVTPDPNFTGPLQMSIRLKDGNVFSDVFTFSASVVPTPVITSVQNFLMTEDVNASISITQLTYTNITSSPGDLEIIIIEGDHYSASGNTVIPEANYNGPLQISIRLKDGNVLSDVFTFSSSVSPVNDKPVITGVQKFSITEDISVSLSLNQVMFTDIDSSPDNIEIIIIDGDHYSVSANTIQPDPDYNGPLQISIRLKDSDVESDAFNFTVTVTPVNDKPIIKGIQNFTLTEDLSTSITLNKIIYTDIDSAPANIEVIILDGDNYSVVFGNTIVPDQDYNGPVQISVRLKDGDVESETYTFSTSVVPVNDPPVITDVVNFTLVEDIPTILSIPQIIFIDIDSSPQNLNVMVIGGDHYSVGPGNTILPDLNYNGPVQISLLLTDGSVASDVYTFTTTVMPVNDKPIITGVQKFSMTEDVNASISLNQILYTDIDSSPSSLEVVVVGGDHYSASGNTIRPDLNYNGPLSVSVKLKDGAVESNIFKTTVQVLAVNDPPVVVSADKNIKCSKGSPLTLRVSMFEISDPDNTTGFSVKPVAGEGYDIIAGALVPHSEKEQKLKVAMVASDGALESNIFVFEIHVLPAVVTGIDPEINVGIWPNPATHLVHHSFDRATEVRIINQSGQVVAKDETRTGTIDISHLPQGLYIIEGRDEQQNRKMFKLLKN